MEKGLGEEKGRRERNQEKDWDGGEEIEVLEKGVD